MTNHDREPTTNRRGLLGLATIGLGATVGGVIAAPVAGALLAPVTRRETFRPVSLGPVHVFNREDGFAPTSGGLRRGSRPSRSCHKAWPTSTPPAATTIGSQPTPCSSSSQTAPHPHGLPSPVHEHRSPHAHAMAASSINGAAAPLPQLPAPSTASNRKIRGDQHLWITQRWSVPLDGDHVRYFPVKPPG